MPHSNEELEPLRQFGRLADRNRQPSIAVGVFVVPGDQADIVPSSQEEELVQHGEEEKDRPRPDPQPDHGKDHRQNATRVSWTAADRVFVFPYEGTPLTVAGYFEVVRPQRASAPTGNQRVGESTNCHAWAEVDTDWHIALVADPSETEDQAVVIEPTPRFKRRNTGWTVTKAQSIAVRRTPTSARNEKRGVCVSA